LLTITKGLGAPEVGRVCSLVRELCRRVGETPLLFPALAGLFISHFMRGELQTARALAEELLSLAQREDDPTLLLGAHHTLAAVSFHLGDFTSSLEHSEQARAFRQHQQDPSKGYIHFGHDPGVMNLCYAAYALGFIGYAAQSRQRSLDALSLARESSRPYDEAVALLFGAWSHQHRRELEEARHCAEAAITLAHDQGFPQPLAFATSALGSTLAEQGQLEEGIAQMRQGMVALRAIGGELGPPYFLALLAEAHGKAGHAEEGLSVLSEALAAMEKTGERYYEAELYRLKGELLLQSKVRGPKSEAPEKYFRQAIDVARRQSAKSFELRAAMSLARLRRSQGKKKEASRMLSEIYGWFTEGFDTADLQEAKALLEELE
jgi:predicted ATPase